MSVIAANRAFNRALSRFAARSEIGIWDAMRKAAFDLMREVALDTPVDTGRARAGWTSFFRWYGTSPPSNPGTNRSAKIQGENEGETYAVGRPPRYKIEIQNRVKYIVYLERGWSGQAPAGMVEINLWRHASHLKRQIGNAEVKG